MVSGIYELWDQTERKSLGIDDWTGKGAGSMVIANMDRVSLGNNEKVLQVVAMTIWRV